MFMVLSHDTNYSKSSHSSSDECKNSAKWLLTLIPSQPTWAVSQAAIVYIQSTITIYYYSAQQLIFILLSH